MFQGRSITQDVVHQSPFLLGLNHANPWNRHYWYENNCIGHKCAVSEFSHISASKIGGCHNEKIWKFQPIPRPWTLTRHPLCHPGRNLFALQHFQQCLPTCNIRGIESWHINNTNIFCKFARASVRALSICTVCTTRYHFQPAKLHTLKLSH